MEPERQIEKWLRAFAKKRKAGGDAFKLHSATRRRLQDAVSRQFADAPEEESVSLWQLFRQQWAFLLVFTLALFLGASLFLPALSKAKNRALNVATASNLKQIGVAVQLAAEENNGKLPATLDMLTNGYISSTNILNDPASGQRFIYIAGGERLDDLQSNSVLAYSLETKKKRGVLLADGRVETVNTREFDEFNQRGLVQRVAQPASLGEMELAKNIPAPASAPVVASGTLAVGNGGTFGGGGGGGAGGTFGAKLDDGLAKDKTSEKSGASAVATDGSTLALAQKVSAAKTESQSEMFQSNLGSNSQRFEQVRNNNNAGKPQPVLASFEFHQNGSAVAVVDRDGSVYNGTIELGANVMPQAPAAPPMERNGDFSNSARNQAAQNQMGVAQNQIGAAQNNGNNGNFFRVTGQNRTTKQNVVFVGSVIPLPSSNANQASNQSQASSFSNICIIGTATVDVTNSVEINAMPVAP
jgi:hypothetical protein